MRDFLTAVWLVAVCIFAVILVIAFLHAGKMFFNSLVYDLPEYIKCLLLR